MAAIVPIASAAPISEAIFDNTQQPLPPNVSSLGFQATSTDEFGDHIEFAGLERTLTGVTVTMSTWAKQSEYPTMTDPAGWMHPITLNLYQVDNTGTSPAPGSLIASTTQSFLIPWRPEADQTCQVGTAWRASDNACYNGLAFNIVFDIASIVVPDEIIYGVAFSTQTHGASPLGVAGPYNSLNVGVNTVSEPSVGVDVDPDAVMWDTSYGPFYADDGAGGTDTFRRDPEWSGLVPAVQFSVTYDVPTTSELVEELRAATDELVTNRGAERALLASLDRIEMYADRGNPFFANLSMLQFVLLVDRFEDARQITPAAAQELLTLAMQVRDSLF